MYEMIGSLFLNGPNKQTAHKHGKYDNNGKGWNFRLNYINKKSYKYIISITWNWMARCNTNNPTYCKENK